VTRRSIAFDVALAAFVLLLGQAEVWGGLFASHERGPRWCLATAYAAAALALIWRRRATLITALTVSGVLALAFAVWGSPEGLAVLAAPSVAAYAAGAHHDRRRGLLALVAILAYGIVWDLRDPADTSGFTEHVLAGMWLSPFVIAFLLGAYRRSRQLYIAQLVREQEERAARSVAEERTRIARELHDVLGHSVSVMIVQASAVRRLLRADQTKERAALQTVETTGREAMSELRKMVGALRSSDEAPNLSPPPSLALLGRLADNFRHAGLAVDVDVRGDLDTLPPALAATAYRVIQESLTNTLRHAAAHRVRVCVDHRDDQLTIDVTDDGHGGLADPSKGVGLLGMRERVQVFGGTLTAQPGTGGGFRVQATLPCGQP
jgi:signal transduction histidine kinase